MDKLKERHDEVRRAFREISEERDRALPASLTLPPVRGAQLQALIRRELPVARDRSPTWPGLRILLVEMRWPAAALAALACVIAAFVVISLEKPEANESPTAPRVVSHRQVVETPASDRFALRVTAAELASWPASFLTANLVSDHATSEAAPALRLDLPIRALLDDDGIASMP